MLDWWSDKDRTPPKSPIPRFAIPWKKVKPCLCENPPHSCTHALSTPLGFVTDAERYNNRYRDRQITKWARVLHIWATESYPSQPHPSYPIMPLPPLPLYRFVLGQNSPWRVKQPTGERLKVWDLPYNSSLGSVDPLHLHELHLESEKHILLMQSRDISGPVSVYLTFDFNTLWWTETLRHHSVQDNMFGCLLDDWLNILTLKSQNEYANMSSKAANQWWDEYMKLQLKND